MVNKKVVLITGCSSGIGRALAGEFYHQGYRVFASARRPESIADLKEKMNTLKLDVTDADQIKQALARIEKDAGRLDILINNAGFAAIGAVAEMPIEDLRQQFETNVFSVIQLTQTAVPLLLKSKNAIVVNIGSVSGILTTPFAGSYCASKAALHALTDALRMELAPFGIRFVTVQPGAIQSNFGNRSEQDLRNRFRKDSLYAPISGAIVRRAQASQEKPTPAAVFARKLVGKLSKKNPPLIVRIGKGGQFLPLLKRALPERLLDRILTKKFELNKLEGRDESNGN
ncbi:MAG: SDR family oxidoreductase [Calditrichaeota bacterium]|nr:SDR family oxidoreductase [Calditrichota bacterium]